MRRFFADLIDPFRASPGAPPQRFGPFVRWALEGGGAALGLAAGCGIALGVTEAIGARLLGWVIDRAQAAGPAAFFSENALALVAVAAFFVVLRPALAAANAGLTSMTLGPGLFPLIVTRLNRHTLGQSLSFFDDDFAGRLVQKQLQTANGLTEVMLETVNSLTFALAALVGALAVLGGVNWGLAALLLLWLAGYALLIRRFLPRIRARSRARAAARAAVTGQIVDTLTNMATVKLFAHRDREETAAEAALTEFRERALDWGATAAQFRALLMTLAGTLPVLLIGGALWLWQQGAASAGDIAAAGLLATRIAQMSGWVSFVAMGIFTNLGEAEDGMRTLAPGHDIVDAPDAVDIGRAEGAIRYENVRFNYGGTEGAGGLNGFDLAIAPGEKVALVGRSGAGKSTALALLLRLYDVEEGRVTLDGHDVRTLTQDSLRRQVAMVRQETAMFNRSARDNILYGRPEAGEDEMLDAARRAEAHDFILELEDGRGRAGYDAYLGERGVKLSGGQRQRIALARAVLKDAPVLALDEATSALDSEVEAAIQQALEGLMEGRTVIAIAHRLSTIARMDRIVVMEQGRVAETGTHEELLARDGLYAGFWRRQSGGFIGLDEDAAAAE